MRHILFLSAILFLGSCRGQNNHNSTDTKPPQPAESAKSISKVDQYYIDHAQDSIPSKSIGSVSKGALEHPNLLPFSGPNYTYFDTNSYLGGRAFMHSTVAEIVSNTYNELLHQNPTRQYRLMECSNEHGGKIYPHRTHQNGLSVDFMMPLQRNNSPYYDLDDIGGPHYVLDFDKEGRYTKDSTISIDFNVAAEHILLLEQEARKKGFRIKKVIFNTDLKDELFASPNGERLKNSGIYITRNLEPVINLLHDDHYHIDFQPVN